MRNEPPWKDAARKASPRYPRAAIVLLLGAVLLYQLAHLTLFLMRGEPPMAPPPDPGRAAADAAGPVDLTALQGLGMFGGAARNDPLPPPAAYQPEAAATSLQLRLEGIVRARPDAASFAVLDGAGAQRVYRAGDRLPLDGRVVLSGIEEGRVLIDNNGALESLWLYDAPQAAAEGSADAGGGAVGQLVRHYREQWRNTEKRLTDIIQVSPVRENGGLAGYRVSAGNHAQAFQDLGFRAGDIITTVNGIDLARADSLSRLYAELSGARTFSFSVRRDGRTVQVDIAPDSLLRLELE